MYACGRSVVMHSCNNYLHLQTNDQTQPNVQLMLKYVNFCFQSCLCNNLTTDRTQ